MLAPTEPTLKTDNHTGQFFDKSSRDEFEAQMNKTVGYLKGFLMREEFYSGEKKEDLDRRRYIASTDGRATVSIEEALEEIKDLYLDHTVAFHIPQYVAHLNCPVLLPALVGDVIASAANTAVETWDQSTSATLIEQEMIRWICSEMGYGGSADGVFTSGGTQSNFMALLMARDHYAFTHFGINLKQDGWSDIVSKFRIFCSDKAHFSIKKNAALLGMGYRSVVEVPTDSTMKMIPEALEEALEKEKDQGNIPIAVVATVGTTDFGSFDPLSRIARIAQAHGIWLHADGAYGGCYVLTETHRHLLKDIAQADSITVDFHKTLFQPLCSSAFLVKDRRRFQYVSYFADYLNPLESRDSEHPNLIEKSIQTTRRFDALKLWFTLKVTGREALGAFLEKVHYLAVEVYHCIKDDPCFEVAHEPELSTLVFRYVPSGLTEGKDRDDINLRIKDSLFRSGRASVASTRLNGRIYLKFTLLNPNSTLEDLQEIVGLIKEKGRSYHLEPQTII